MPSRRQLVFVLGSLAALAGLAALACVEEARPTWLGGTLGQPAGASGGTGTTAGASAASGLFTEVLISARTFVDGRVVVTSTYNVDDMGRTPMQADFNHDGRIDPVVAYQQGVLGVAQILLSYGGPRGQAYVSLTLDGGENDWKQLSDVAVGDIDGDGNLDLVLATSDGVAYLRHPSDPARTHILNEWGAQSGDLELVEGTVSALTKEELNAIIISTLGDTFDQSAYIASVEEGYSAVELGDFNNDGALDIVAARSIKISLDPKPDYNVPPVSITSGNLQLLLNPGRAIDGRFWTGVPIGLHERHGIFDRQGSGDLRAIDLDGDGDLDIVSAALDDNNVQISWFENPGGPGGVDPAQPWRQFRIGSLRGAARIDVADLTGDGRPDVVGVSPAQQQCVLFVQPEEGPARGYDWFSTPIITFQTYEPRAVLAIDLDRDGRNEVVIGGTNGAVRYFKRSWDVVSPWTGAIVWTFDPPGAVGLLGYGDLDGDGDIDLVAVQSGEDAAANRVSWLKSNLIRTE